MHNACPFLLLLFADSSWSQFDLRLLVVCILLFAFYFLHFATMFLVDCSPSSIQQNGDEYSRRKGSASPSVIRYYVPQDKQN